MKIIAAITKAMATVTADVSRRSCSRIVAVGIGGSKTRGRIGQGVHGGIGTVRDTLRTLVLVGRGDIIVEAIIKGVLPHPASASTSVAVVAVGGWLGIIVDVDVDVDVDVGDTGGGTVHTIVHGLKILVDNIGLCHPHATANATALRHVLGGEWNFGLCNSFLGKLLLLLARLAPLGRPTASSVSAATAAAATSTSGAAAATS